MLVPGRDGGLVESLGHRSGMHGVWGLQTKTHPPPSSLSHPSLSQKVGEGLNVVHPYVKKESKLTLIFRYFLNPVT